MNVKTGEILRALEISQYNEAAKRRFTPIPDDFADEVAEILREQDRTFADMSKKTPLIKWAKEQRSKCSSVIKYNKNKRKMAKKSRKKNRK